MRNLLVDFMNRKQRALPNNPEKKLEKTALGLNNIKESPMSRVALNFWGNESVQIQSPQSKSRFLWFQEIQDPLQNLTMRDGGMVSFPSGVWTMAEMPQNLNSSLPVKSYIDDQLKESLNKWIEAKKSERRARDKAKEEAKKLQQEKIEKSKRSYQFWTLIQMANESWGDLSRMDTIDKKTANEYFPDLYNDSKGFRNLKTNLEKVFAGEKEYGELLAAYAENKPWYIDDWYTKEEKQWLKQGGRRSETLQNKPLWGKIGDALDSINIVWKGWEELDNLAQKIPTANSFLKMENRETKLQNRVKGLSEEERWALEDKYETSPLLKTLYGNFDNYLKATQRTFGDELFDVWYTGVGPNLGKMFANIPSSTVKTLTATGRWITNPADTVAGIGQMLLTEEGRGAMKDRYWNNLDKTIEEDPIGTASDALTVAELGAKGVSGGLKVSGLTKNAKIWAVSQKVADFGKTAWEVADLGLGKLYWKGMERLRDVQKNSNNILLKAGATYLRSTQEPLKVASEWLNAGVNKLIGLDKRTKQALENNPFVWKYFEKTKEYIEENGLSPESKKEINTEHIRGLSSEILDMIENKKDTLRDTGELYEKIKNANVKFESTGVKEKLNSYLEENGIRIVDWKLDFSDSVIVKEGDMKAIEKAYDWATREGYQAKVGLNQRKKMDKIAYPDGAPSAWTEIIRGMRSIFDENMKEKIPGLKEADKLYSEKIKELEQIEDGLIYKQGNRKGQLRDNFEQIINTLDWPNRARMLQRLDELRPGLGDEIKAVHMMGKLTDMYFKTPTKLSGYLTNAAGIIWGGAIGSRYGIGGMIVGAISGWLAKQGATKLSQNAIRKAIDNVAPNSLERLKEVEKKIQAGKGMSPQERALIDQIGARILQESELLNDTRSKTHALPAPKATVIWKNWPQVKNPLTPEPMRRKVVEIDRRPKWGNVLGDTIARNAKPVDKRGENAVGLKTTKKTWNSEKTEYTTDDASNTASVSLTEKKNKVTWTKISSSWATARGWNSGRPTTDFSDLEKTKTKWGRFDLSGVKEEYQRNYDKIVNREGDNLEVGRIDWKVAYDGKERPAIFSQAIQNKIVWDHWLDKANLLATVNQPDYIIKNVDGKADKINIIKKIEWTNDFVLIAADRQNGYFILSNYEVKSRNSKRLIKSLSRWEVVIDNVGDSSSLNHEPKNLLVPFMNKSPKWGEKYQVAKIYQQAGSIYSDNFKKWFGDWENDPKNASKVVNEKGEPLLMYHGSPEKFTIFDSDFMSQHGSSKGYGFYFSPDKKMAEGYGDVMTVYLDIKNPLSKDKLSISRKEMKNLILDVEKNIAEKWGSEDGTLLDNFGDTRRYGRDRVLEDAIDMLMENENDVDVFWELKNIGGDYDSVAKSFRKIPKKDGIITPKEYIVFESNQIKSATDNIWAFDSSNPDIRYQKHGVANPLEKNISAQRAIQLENIRNGRSVQELADHYGIDIQTVDKITTPEGLKAYGKYGDWIITLAEKIKEGTAPHELFHATFDIVDHARKESILEGVMEEKKLDKVQAEEYLADSFSEYFRTWRMKGEKVIWNVGKPLWKRIYDAVKDFFKKVKDWITGVSKNKNQIKKLFDDILDGEIDKEMLWEILGNKKGTDTHRHQQSWPRLVSVPMKSSISIIPENASIFTSRLNNLGKVIKNWGFTATDFLDGLKNTLNIDKKSWYLISQKNGSTATLRISDHYANARNNKIRWYVENNTSIVIKLWSGKFKVKNGVDLVEFVYNPENLTPEKMQGIIKGIQDWIDTGEYTDKNYDLTHKSIRATLEGWEVKYQRVYHGSPYEFEKFDSAHIGKGEGAQAHGWGHYVAVDRETGARYANVLPKPKYQGNSNWQIPQGWIENSIVSNILTRLKDSSSVKEAIRKEKMLWNWYEKSERIDRGLKFLDEIKESDFEYQNKNLYEVEIPDNHWVNYLEEQKNLNPEQKNMIKKGLVDFLVEERWFDKKEAQRMTNTILKNAKTGDALYSNLTFQIFFDKKEVSKFLDKIGFDWIHYSWGIDWEAYVIFDNNKLEIKKHEKL